MTVLIDSWAWIEYWKGGKFSSKAAEYIEGSEEAVVSTINLAEIWFWVARYYDEKTATARLETVEKRCHTISVDKDIAVGGAKIRISNKLALADSLILATARQTGGKVVSGDPDLKDLEDVIFLPRR
ncbi:MAG TPA: type II toxin-antitoxin system VapC family toxin [Nitrososphaerales archaeon]|nr:type II toxin-antitoxin system VapC family toxin [Nitrososphaerales archaeon]